MTETKVTNNKSTTKKKRHNYNPQLDFELLINRALKQAEIPISKLFIDKVENKSFLRKMTVRTAEGKHFRMVIGRQELITGFEMFCAILKAKYKEALKQPDITRTNNGRAKLHHKKSSDKRTYSSKPNNKGRMGKPVKTSDGNASKGKSTVEPGQVPVHSKTRHAGFSKRQN